MGKGDKRSWKMQTEFSMSPGPETGWTWTITIYNTILTLTTQSWCRRHRLKGAVPHEAALTSDTSCRFGRLQATCSSDELTINLGAPSTPSDSMICYNNSQNSGNHYTCG